MAETLTRSQSAIDAVLFDIADHQRTFDLNYGNAIAVVRRTLIHEVTVATATGLVLGGLVGAIVGLGRRR